MDNKIQESKEQKAAVEPKKRPDEIGGIHLQGHIKIFDPETKEVFVNERA